MPVILHLSFFARRDDFWGPWWGGRPRPQPDPPVGLLLKFGDRSEKPDVASGAVRGDRPTNVTNPSLFSTDIAALFAAKPRCATSIDMNGINGDNRSIVQFSPNSCGNVLRQLLEIGLHQN